MDFPGSRGSGEEEPPRPFDEGLEFDFDPFPKPPRATPGAERARRRPRRAAARPRQPPPPRRPPSETLARIAWALPWIVFAVAIVAIGGAVFAVAMIGFAWIALAELFRMGRSFRPIVPVAFLAAAGMMVAAYYGTHFQIVLVGLAAFPLMLAFTATDRGGGATLASLAITVFGIVWIAIPFAHAVLLRELPDHGGALLIDVLVATFVTDTAAYAGGRLFGSRPLAPSLSPNKTVEGLAFGIVGGTLGFWFAGLYQDWLPGLDALVMGFVIAILAPVGDLFESMIKRDLGYKDSGRVFGPHGGLLDRLDAVLFTVVAGYYLAVAFVY